MRRDEVFAILAAHRDELKQTHGVASLALFGSVARDEARPDSDVDLLVEFDRPVGLFEFVDLKMALEQWLGCPVDLGTPRSLRERVRAEVERDIVHVLQTLTPGNQSMDWRVPPSPQVQDEDHEEAREESEQDQEQAEHDPQSGSAAHVPLRLQPG